MMKKAIWIAFLMVGMAGIGMGNTVTIPGDAWTVYDIPEGGAALQLNINRANDNLVIDDSEIQLQDSSDTVQWSRSSASQATHVYQIGTVLSAREYLRVFGHWHYTNGTGPGPHPTFYAKVAAPDVDIGSLTEEQEESVGVWLPKGGTRTAVTVQAVQCQSPSSSQQTLSWSGQVSLWTAAGTSLGGSPYQLSANGATYYAQGENASSGIRDAWIQTAYTISGQGTAQDKVKLTVVGATLSSFSTVLINATQDVSVTLSPNPPGITNTLQIVCLSGSGSAQFTPSGGTSLDIGQSGTVKIKGVTASSVSNNMLLKAVMDGTILASNVFTVVAPEVEMKSVVFTSDHGVLTDYNTDYAGSGGTVYNPRGWIKGGANNPITHVKDNKITANVTLCVQPSGISFNLIGDGPIGALDFHTNGLTSTGSDQVISVTSDEKLPAGIDVLSNSISWSINVGGQTYGNESSGLHKIYVTWGLPGSGPSLKRVNKVCNTALGQNTSESIADSLQNMVASNTTFGSGDVDGWALLDGGSGDCDNQARCMKYTFEMPGAGSANVQFVYASSNAGQGNCLDLESRVVSNQTHYLVMDFDTGGGNNWNAFEGCCEAASHYYAITPKKKASNDYGMLQALGCQQFWVRTLYDILPGNEGWEVIEIIEEVQIP